MTDIRSKCREKQFRILCGVKEICDSAGIRLILLGDSALAALRGEFCTDSIDAGIDASDVKKFILAFRSSGTDLVMDSASDNPDFPIFELRIYDPETVDLDITDFRNYRYNSLYVRLVIIRHIPKSKIKRKLASSLSSSYEILRQIHSGSRKSSASKMVKYLQRMQKRRGREYVSDWLFNRLISAYGNASGRLIVDGRKCSGNILRGCPCAEVNGVQFFIPADTDQYFRTVYGPGWKEHEIPEFRDTAEHFMDPDHSWKELSGKFADMDFDTYDRKVRKYRSLSRTFSKHHKKVREYRDILGRTDLRYHMWQKYMPMKDSLIRLRSEGKYDELAEILKDYTDAMHQCMKQGLGLCFDEEILDIALDVLRHRGDSKADVMESLVPPEHREPLRLKNYKGEYI